MLLDPIASREIFPRGLCAIRYSSLLKDEDSAESEICVEGGGDSDLRHHNKQDRDLHSISSSSSSSSS